MLGKDLEGQGCGQQLESYIHTPKPQIQDVEPRRRRLGIRTISCVFGEIEESRNFDVFFWVFFVFERGEKRVEKTSRKKNSKKKKK